MRQDEERSSLTQLKQPSKTHSVATNTQWGLQWRTGIEWGVQYGHGGFSSTVPCVDYITTSSMQWFSGTSMSSGTKDTQSRVRVQWQIYILKDLDSIWRCTQSHCSILFNIRKRMRCFLQNLLNVFKIRSHFVQCFQMTFAEMSSGKLLFVNTAELLYYNWKDWFQNKQKRKLKAKVWPIKYSELN